MRIVYDDAHQMEFRNAISLFMRVLDVKKLVKYEHGMKRVQQHLLRSALDHFLEAYSMEIGNKVTHAYGIGNNCNYPVYYHEGNEIQHCANININTSPFGDCFVSIEDYNGKRIGAIFKLSQHGIKMEV